MINLSLVFAELMVLGFISLLLTVGQGPISAICVSKGVGNSWHPCDKKQENSKFGDGKENGSVGRRLLFETHRRALAGASNDRCADKGKVSLVSSDGIHQLHMFIFVLAIFHVLCSLITLALGRAKVHMFLSQTVFYSYTYTNTSTCCRARVNYIILFLST